MEVIYTVCCHGARIRRVYSCRIYTVVCSQGGEFFHLDYSSSEYSYAMCSHEGEQSPGIFLYGVKTPCVVTGVSFLTRTVPLWKIYTPCVATGGEDSPGIFPRNIYMPCVITGMSFLTRIIPLGNLHTPCVITGARTRRVYAYTEYIYTPRVVTGVNFAHQNFSFTERALAVCTQFVIVYELC